MIFPSKSLWTPASGITFQFRLIYLPYLWSPCKCLESGLISLQHCRWGLTWATLAIPAPDHTLGSPETIVIVVATNRVEMLSCLHLPILLVIDGLFLDFLSEFIYHYSRIKMWSLICTFARLFVTSFWGLLVVEKLWRLQVLGPPFLWSEWR